MRGTTLDTPEKKKKLRRLKWPHRFREALRNENISRWVLTEGFWRLERIRDREMTIEVDTEGQEEPIDVETTIGEIFQRDVSQALLLDWHINTPGYVWSQGRANQWRRSVEELFEEWGVASAEDLPVGASGDKRENRERQLVVTLLKARLGDDEGSMTDPGLRAGKVLAYANDDLIKEVARTEDYTMAQGYKSIEALIRDFLRTEVNKRAADTWDSIDRPTTLEFDSP